MTSLTPDPLIVSLVQVAANLPLFLFAIPAGALADILDRRRYLIAIEGSVTLICLAFALIITFGVVTPRILLIFAFLVGTCAALGFPAWQAIVPQLVPRDDLQTAIAINSVGVNISRALGPALSGVLTGAFGVPSPFWVNAFSNFGIVGSLLWWRPLKTDNAPALPAERLVSAIQVGFRHTRNNPSLRATLARSIAFFLFASAYWALLPLVARNRIGGGPELYGLLLGAIGAGAVGGAFLLPQLKKRLGADRLVAAGTLGTAVSILLFGLAHHAAIAFVASLIAGICWIAVLSSLNVSAQLSLPEWVRARGLAMYVTAFFGAMTLGSVIWGEVAAVFGVSAAQVLAAVLAAIAIPLTRRWKLQADPTLDLAPSMQWPAPVTSHEIEPELGPVLVTVEYRIRRADREAFLRAIGKLARARKRDGGYNWGVFEDTAEDGRFVETFYADSWLEHARQHARNTNTDWRIQESVDRFQIAGVPKVTHFVAAAPRR
jgi:MFS family permease